MISQTKDNITIWWIAGVPDKLTALVKEYDKETKEKVTTERNETVWNNLHHKWFFVSI